MQGRGYQAYIIRDKINQMIKDWGMREDLIKFNNNIADWCNENDIDIF